MYVCEYYPPSGGHREILLDGNRTEDVCRGFYVCTDDAVIGLYASQRGPVVFRNAQEYVLRAGAYAMELVEKERTRVFRLTVSGEEAFSVEYRRPQWIDDAPVDEETADFFLWLYRGQKDPRFHTFFTTAE